MTVRLWEPLAGRVVEVPEWDTRAAFLRLQDAAPVRLEDMTLGQLEALHARDFTQQDAAGELPYCTRCLADLPFDAFLQMEHRCGEPAPDPGLLPREQEHKTRTSQPSGYNEVVPGVRRFDKRGRVMHDRFSYWSCTCGKTGAGATREEARSWARKHREDEAAIAAARAGL